MIEVLSIDIEKPQPERLEQARQILVDGGLVIVPTETVYGIACDPAVPGALEKLVAAKGRDGDKPIAQLAANAEQVAAAVANWNEGVQALAARYWPGPLTIVLETLAGWTGYRVPDHAVAIALALSLDTDMPHWYTIQSMIYGVAMFSLVVQAPTARTNFSARFRAP